VGTNLAYHITYPRRARIDSNQLRVAFRRVVELYQHAISQGS